MSISDQAYKAKLRLLEARLKAIKENPNPIAALIEYSKSPDNLAKELIRNHQEEIQHLFTSDTQFVEFFKTNDGLARAVLLDSSEWLAQLFNDPDIYAVC